MNTKQHKSNLIKIYVGEVPQTSAIEEMRVDVSAFNASLMSFDASLTAFDSSLSELRTDFDIFDLNTSRGLAQLNTSIIDIQEQIDGLSVSQIANLETRLNAVDSALVDLSAGLRTANNTLSYVQGVQTLANSSIARLDASVGSAFVNIANLTERVNELSGSTSGDAQHLANIDASINALRARSNLQDASINALTDYVDARVTDLISSIAQETQSAKSIALDASDAVTQFVQTFNNYYIPQVNSSINAVETGFANFTNALNSSFESYTATLDSSLTVYADTLNTSIADYTATLNTSLSAFAGSLNSSFVALDASFSQYRDTLDTSLSAYRDGLDASFATMQTTVNNSLQTMRTDINNFEQ